MLKKNKTKMLLSSLIILLPMLFGIIMWKDLPDMMTTHWGTGCSADGFSPKAFAVFGLPGLLLATHIFCIIFTLLDKQQRKQNPKVLGMVFWILPVLSLTVNGIMYRSALGFDVDVMLIISILMGAMFLLIGNYLPKARQNRTLGIKITWTLHNEENWNKTHRLAGKLWVAGGAILLLGVFLPLEAMLWLLLSVITTMTAIPIAYSYSVYRQHQKQGIVYAAAPRSKTEKITVRISAVLISVLLIGLAAVMFTGDIEVSCEDTSFRINASYWADLEVDYSDVDTVFYRKDLDVGIKTNGFNSAKLLMGVFQNEEFGAYTLYAYTGATEFVVLTSGEKTLVIGMRDTKDTQALFDTISEKIGGK